MNIEPTGKIVKAAIRYNDFIFTGYRHHEIRDDIRNKTGIGRYQLVQLMADEASVGFVTENGTFLTRKEALIYGRKKGQICNIIGSVLTSEDLWATPKDYMNLEN